MNRYEEIMSMPARDRMLEYNIPEDFLEGVESIYQLEDKLVNTQLGWNDRSAEDFNMCFAHAALHDKYNRWLREEVNPRCPKCFRRVDETANFCPNCGAKMEKTEES